MNWQPIETAPKDELILVARTKRMCGPCAAMNHSQDGWVTETPGEWVSIYTPTHWMPLPAAPGGGCQHPGRSIPATKRQEAEAIKAEFLERTGQYLTNDASREACIAEAVAAEREACAKVCEGMHEEDRPHHYAEAIRDRCLDQHGGAA